MPGAAGSPATSKPRLSRGKTEHMPWIIQNSSSNVVRCLYVICTAGDVLVNATVALRYGFDWAAFGAQCLFVVIVLATVGPAWRGCAINLNRASRSSLFIYITSALFNA